MTKGQPSIDELLEIAREALSNPPVRNPRRIDAPLRSAYSRAQEAKHGVMEDKSSAIPAPDLHPYFDVVEGRLSFSEAAHRSNAADDLTAIRSLLPILQQEVGVAVDLFSNSNRHPAILRGLSRYQAAISQDTKNLDFGAIAAYGMMLSNAEHAAGRSFDRDLATEMSDAQSISIANIMALHGPLVLSSAVGRTVVENAASFHLSTEEMSEMQEAATALATALADEGIATPEVASFLKDAARSIGEGNQPIRSAGLGISILESAIVPLIAAAAFVSGPVGLTGGVFGVAATLWMKEALKRRTDGQPLEKDNDLSISEQGDPGGFRKAQAFIVRHQSDLRLWAGHRQSFPLIDSWLDIILRRPHRD